MLATEDGVAAQRCVRRSSLARHHDGRTSRRAMVRRRTKKAPQSHMTLHMIAKRAVGGLSSLSPISKAEAAPSRAQCPALVRSRSALSAPAPRPRARRHRTRACPGDARQAGRRGHDPLASRCGLRRAHYRSERQRSANRVQHAASPAPRLYGAGALGAGCRSESWRCDAGVAQLIDQQLLQDFQSGFVARFGARDEHVLRVRRTQQPPAFLRLHPHAIDR